MAVSEQVNPWINWAASWSLPSASALESVYRTRISMQTTSRCVSTWLVLVNMITPSAMYGVLTPISVYYGRDTKITLEFTEPEQIPRPDAYVLRAMRRATALHTHAASPQYQCIHDDNANQGFGLLFCPDQSFDTLNQWVNENSGSEPAIHAHARGLTPANMGIVRDTTRYNKPLIFKRWVYARKGTVLELYIECEKLSARQKELYRSFESDEVLLPPDESKTATMKTLVPAQTCTIDKLPYTRSLLSLFIPAIIDNLEKHLLAATLNSTVFKDMQFTSLDHLILALTAPSARPHSTRHYQRYEFFGDAVLKYMISSQLFHQHREWQEHELTDARDALVQNQCLAKVAVEAGLDGFVITQKMSHRYCRIPLVSRKSESGRYATAKRDLAAKTLADVVEALIGAAYVDGGPVLARVCIQRLLPEISLGICDTAAAEPKPKPSLSSDSLVEDRLQTLLRYQFLNKSLLVEALTHPSCAQAPNPTTSYQRLEFLGDAVLDMIIVNHLIRTPAEIPPGEMTLIKHAMSNGNLLAFFCLEISLWRFMRTNNPSLISSQMAVVSRYLSLSDEIRMGIQQGTKYPWQALCELNADKHFSDLIESTLSAIFVDSGGLLSTCESFLERIGLMGYLRRILADGVDVAHPKNVVQKMSNSRAEFAVVRRVDTDNHVGEVSYDCLVKIQGVKLASVEGCLCRAAAEVKAANAAIKALKLLQSKISKNCTE
ncbi:ribonuclease III domain-containing protein [Aspergillus crustosus]